MDITVELWCFPRFHATGLRQEFVGPTRDVTAEVLNASDQARSARMNRPRLFVAFGNKDALVLIIGPERMYEAHYLPEELAEVCSPLIPAGMESRGAGELRVEYRGDSPQRVLLQSNDSVVFDPQLACRTLGEAIRHAFGCEVALQGCWRY